MSSTAVIDQEKSVYYRDVAIIRYNKKRGTFFNKPPGESSEVALPVQEGQIPELFSYSP